ncbi:MAG: hypothetical protein A2902_07135 [Elusimicrobia bacterium RIFCSPLOWO2_01_FULL_64_13]|nr:MAG: hypothetical protein A2902_07135 [Elusimicrobia bacterium RIFCSPLOWO2_01_FULL_64_13]
MSKHLMPQEAIVNKIFSFRGHKVMLDRDLSELYGVPAGRLNEQVRRNIKRFPGDFMFQLTRAEAEILRSQIAISSWGGRRYRPYAFTEQGVSMLSSVLNSERAIQVNIRIMRTFTKLKQIMFTNKELAAKLHILERRFTEHDKKFEIVFDAIRSLIQAPKDETRKIGFKS